MITEYAGAQIPEKIKNIFPAGTVMHNDLSYASDTLKRHKLDIYLPKNVKGNLPLIVWIHGGAWKLNDKFADMGYMKKTVSSFIEQGYAFASIDYRYSTDAIFPAQIQDCNQAISWLCANAQKYHIDKSKIAVIGFSAGGHLASLLALSNNNNVKQFSVKGKNIPFKIKAVIDFYGPSNFLALIPKVEINDPTDALTSLLGGTVLERPDLATMASPTTYVDANDPPFLIFHGEKDESVPYTQSVLLNSYLRHVNVKTELIVVPNAPHYGEMFDVESNRTKIAAFLKMHLK
ncbi:alpha/beta hydrolase [Dyadobacter sp. CY345]|uniref:alpha/beta hydrolase n=1 Tax=Dyadobacter sp. CY345 TaxID=2909335 RepID=UPI001F42D70D|nr:alpha/beta hydrolase [Dyadobacter sp. CY345]MCF2444252.1 alpha/beta hydrolase [Dyadobacter sp. CY345]